MDTERPTTAQTSTDKSMAWRTGDDVNRPSSQLGRPTTGLSRPQTRHERPVSRRGIQTELSRTGSALRTSTPSRTGLTRPPSASAHSNRGATANYRQNTMSSAMGSSKISSGLPSTSHMSTGVIDRPITQQGLTGVRPGTTRGLPMSRQIQDKRYYEGLLQLKIRELNQEITGISKEIDTQNKERATFMHYDNRAKELAAELTELQGRLADYNIVMDKVASNVDKETIEQEVAELNAANDQAANEIEKLFEERRLKEQQLRDMETRIEAEQLNSERIVESMAPNVRAKYDKLLNERNELENKISMMQNDIDSLSAERHSLEEQISLSQVKQEAVKLRIKIAEAEEKKSKLQEEQKNKLSPDEERERLLARVKQDNMDTMAAERRITDTEKQIAETEQELEQLETDLDENYSEKQVKYNELRKREEAIELFMPTFEANKEEELKKLANLEEKVVEKLQRLAYSIDNNGHLTAGDEMAILDSKNDDTEADRSFEGLSKEHLRLQQTLIKMENLEKKLTDEQIELNDKISKRKDELIVLEDVEGFKAQIEQKHEELLSRKDELTARQPECDKELKILMQEYGELKSELEKNDTFLQISTLEDKFESIKKSNEQIQNFIIQTRDRMNYQPVRENTFELMKKYNEVLHDSVKPIY